MFFTSYSGTCCLPSKLYQSVLSFFVLQFLQIILLAILLLRHILRMVRQTLIILCRRCTEF